jgi:ribonuclease PH
MHRINTGAEQAQKQNTWILVRGTNQGLLTRRQNMHPISTHMFAASAVEGRRVVVGRLIQTEGHRMPV